MDKVKIKELQLQGDIGLLTDHIQQNLARHGRDMVIRCIVDALQANSGRLSDLELDLDLIRFYVRMDRYARTKAFPGDNCYDGTILEGGGGPAQY